MTKDQSLKFMRSLDKVLCGNKKVYWPNLQLISEHPDVMKYLYENDRIDQVDRNDIICLANHLGMKKDIQLGAPINRSSRSGIEQMQFPIVGENMVIGIGNYEPHRVIHQVDNITLTFMADRFVKTWFFPILVKNRAMNISLESAYNVGAVKVIRKTTEQLEYNRNLYYNLKYQLLNDENRILEASIETKDYPTFSVDSALADFFENHTMDEMTPVNFLNYANEKKELLESRMFKVRYGSYSQDKVEFHHGRIPMEFKSAYEKSEDSVKQLAYTLSSKN